MAVRWILDTISMRFLFERAESQTLDNAFNKKN